MTRAGFLPVVFHDSLLRVDSGRNVMTVGVSISRTDLDSAGLRRAAARSQDADAARRMLALALVLDGRTRTEAAQLCGMDRQTLRDWVHQIGRAHV